MKGKILGLLAVALGLNAGAPPLQAAIIEVGSSYSLAVQDYYSGESIFRNTFDGIAENFTRTHGFVEATEVTVSESQFDLGGGAHEVNIVLTANSDLFPGSGGTTNNRVYLGYDGNPLKLLRPARLVQGSVWILSDGNYLHLHFMNLDHPYYSSDPWDGTLYGGIGYGVLNAGGRGFDEYRFQFYLQEYLQAVPEPGTLALLGLGLVGMGLRRRIKAS